ncbi:AB hydrolase-1 domain-containing protein [Mycena sanguinolenta]|uniref:AB hydrolase-1 domain-containing protein n=1 Tax=Mycena sanguinolenta TaxID=230812 RepID=A0A8H7DL39_9AGAR|nr:AB hydrolase-1 domain-containing protein [Mycena sanguinolenta]
MESNLTFVLVPGAAHVSAHFKSLVAALNAKGYPTEVVSNPSVGPFAGTLPPNADVVNLRRILEELVNEQQKDIVLVCHSYGGVPGSQSVNGLEKSTARKGGCFEGGVFECIPTTAGASEAVSTQWVEIDATRGIMIPQRSVAAEVLYHDLVESQAQHWAAKLEPMAVSVTAAPVANVCWGADVPKVYIFCKMDRAIPFEGQRKMVERVQIENKESWKTYEMNCGHSPFLSHVEHLVEILVEA